MTTFAELCKLKNYPNNDRGERSPALPDLIAIDFLKIGANIERFDRHLKNWTKVDNILINRTWFGAQFINGQLYIFGGRIGCVRETYVRSEL